MLSHVNVEINLGLKNFAAVLTHRALEMFRALGKVVGFKVIEKTFQVGVISPAYRADEIVL